jgi:hypothetical protein
MANLFKLTSRLLDFKAEQATVPEEKKQKLILTIDKDGQFVITRHGKTGLYSSDYPRQNDVIPPVNRLLPS